MKFKKYILSMTSAALLLSPLVSVSAQTQAWQARTIDQVLADLKVNEEEGTVYTIQYGDTLSVIAEALGIDVNVLGSVNDIVDLDLIYPDTILTTTYDDDQVAQTLTIETPQADQDEESLVAEINLTDNELTFEETVYEIAPQEETQVDQVPEWVTTVEETTVVEETIASAPTTTEASTLVAEWVAPETTAAPVVTEAQVVTEAPQASEPVQAETTTSVAEWVEETSVIEEIQAPQTESESTSQVSLEVVESVVEAPVTETTELVTEAPVTEAPVTEATTVAAVDFSGLNAGLQPQTIAFRDEVASAFGVSSFSLYRPGDSGDHGKGLAVDFMVPVSSAQGDQIAEYAAAQVASGRVDYVIWKQQIYGSWNMSWVPMEDRGSITANHYDHVHVTLK